MSLNFILTGKSNKPIKRAQITACEQDKPDYFNSTYVTLTVPLLGHPN